MLFQPAILYVCPLQRSLPALRQLTPDSTAFIQQSQLPQPASTPVTSASPISSTVVLSSPAPHLPVPVSRPQFQPGVTKPGQTTSLVDRSKKNIKYTSIIWWIVWNILLESVTGSPATAAESSVESSGNLSNYPHGDPQEPGPQSHSAGTAACPT